MPELSERYARGDEAGYRDTLSFGLRTMAFIIVPASIGLVALSIPIVGLLYERGNFTSEDTAVVANLLIAYSVGLLGFAAYFLLIRAFYSRQNTRTPALLNVSLFALYAVLAYGLSYSVGLVGVALAYSVVSLVLTVFGLAAMKREVGSIDGRRLARSLARMLAAGAIMYAVARAGTAILGTGSDILERVVILLVVGGVSLAAYLGVAYLLGTEEFKAAATVLRRRVERA
jgi:putative peptidoglycan lipid II flippase